MNILVVGNGGREHAIVWALRRSPRVQAIHVAPGNAGTAALATNVPIAADDVPALVSYADQERFDLVVVGPEVPLSLGLVDALEVKGLRVFGPRAAAAQIESSKAFSKDFMRRHGIRTADYAVFECHDDALSYLNHHPAPLVVKASGLAAGKGAIVCTTDIEAQHAVDRIMQEREFGAAGDQVVIEAFLPGQEVSVLAFADGKTVKPMVLSQDHKPAYDGDQGPNTGGMGSYAPAPVLQGPMMQRAIDEVLQPLVSGMAADGTPYSGVIYAGLMVDGDDFQVLEFNCRFGDPEAQVILPLLQTDLVDVLEACVEGRLDQIELSWSSQSCLCVVMASAGYPLHYRTGAPISGLEEAAALPATMVYHAGTKLEHDQVLTAGGRVLAVTACGDNLREAMDRAYQATSCIHWNGATYRHDIGAKGLSKGAS
jgi:phosphoribosylamine--glycine ligase